VTTVYRVLPPFVRLSLLILVWGGAASCALKEAPRTHIVMAHSQGWAVAPVKGFERLTAPQYDAELDGIFASMETFCKTRKPCQILFYVHGGMNTQTGTVNRAAETYERIQNSDVYPVFLNWNSSFPSSWWDHLAKVRKGLWSNGNIVVSPYILASDQLQAIPEAPAAWTAEARHAFPRLGPNNPAVRAYVDLVKSPDGLLVNDIRGTKDALLDERTLREKHQAKLLFPLTLLPKLATAPLVIQPWGTGAWDIMLRRTTMLFRTEESFRNRPTTSPPADTGAAFAYFLKRFQTHFMERICRGLVPGEPGEQNSDVVKLNTRIDDTLVPDCHDTIRLTLVGHSMGAIIVNQGLREVPQLDVANVVYMASAGSVRDYRDTVLPFMQRHPRTQMFHLVLHPRAEVQEVAAFELAPRGTLLVWIDNYFSNPIAPIDRTAGRFFNIAQELRFTDDHLRSRMHLKVFRVGQRTSCWNPQEHSDFGNFPYWDRRFWDPAEPTTSGAPSRWRDGNCPVAAGVPTTLAP
jgi:hypothetical protein